MELQRTNGDMVVNELPIVLQNVAQQRTKSDLLAPVVHSPLFN